MMFYDFWNPVVTNELITLPFTFETKSKPLACLNAIKPFLFTQMPVADGPFFMGNSLSILYGSVAFDTKLSMLDF